MPFHLMLYLPEKTAEFIIFYPPGSNYFKTPRALSGEGIHGFINLEI